MQLWGGVSAHPTQCYRYQVPCIRPNAIHPTRSLTAASPALQTTHNSMHDNGMGSHTLFPSVLPCVHSRQEPSSFGYQMSQSLIPGRVSSVAALDQCERIARRDGQSQCFSLVPVQSISPSHWLCLQLLDLFSASSPPLVSPCPYESLQYRYSQCSTRSSVSLTTVDGYQCCLGACAVLLRGFALCSPSTGPKPSSPPSLLIGSSFPDQSQSSPLCRSSLPPFPSFCGL